MIFSFKHYFIFFNVYAHLGVLFVELVRGRSCVGYLHFFCFFYYLSEHHHSHTSLILLIVWNFPLLAFCFLFVFIVDRTQMYPSFISPLGLFQGIIHDTERLKGSTLEPWIIGGPDLKRRGPQTPLHTMTQVSNFTSKLGKNASNIRENQSMGN